MFTLGNEVGEKDILHLLYFTIPVIEKIDFQLHNLIFHFSSQVSQISCLA